MLYIGVYVLARHAIGTVLIWLVFLALCLPLLLALVSIVAMLHIDNLLLILMLIVS
jgi:hypothetical protein